MTDVTFDPDKIKTRKGRPGEIVFSRIREAVELVDSTLDVRITSGRNTSEGRQGSGRHDSGFTADFQLIRNGKVIPAGDPIHREIFSRLPSVGFNELGVSKADGFIHAGFNSPSDPPGAWGYGAVAPSYVLLNRDLPDYVKALQRALGIKADGVYGKDTQEALAKIDFLQPPRGTAVATHLKGFVGDPPPYADLSTKLMAADVERDLGGGDVQSGVGQQPPQQDSVQAVVDDALLTIHGISRDEAPATPEFKPLSRQEFGVRFVGGDSPNGEAKGDRSPVTGGGESGSARQKAPPKYYIPIPRPNPLANRRGALVPRDRRPVAPQFQDSAAPHEFIMSTAREIVADKRSQRGVRRSGLGLFGLPKPTSVIG